MRLSPCQTITCRDFLCMDPEVESHRRSSSARQTLARGYRSSQRTEITTMSTQLGQPQWPTLEGTSGGSSGSLSPLGATRTTGKLLATQGYVVGIEMSGSGRRHSVALADLGGNILHQVRHSLKYVPDTKTVLSLIEDMLAEAMTPERLHNGRILRVGVAVGGLVDATHGIVRTLHHAHGWNDFPLQDYLSERLDIPCIIDNNANAAALAEVQYGATSVKGLNPRNAERVVLYVGLGRGIGGGLVGQRGRLPLGAMLGGGTLPPVG